MLRQFLYDGFNRDEQDRRVFDGLFVHLAGGARGSFNHRFAQASRASWNYLYPNAIFPFSDATQTDPHSGQSDGLFSHVEAEHLPRIIYTNSSNEYWRGTAALTHVSIDGNRDLVLPDNTRSYLLAGTQHVPAAFPPEGGNGQLAPNPNNYRWFLRALLARLDLWTQDLRPPPPSAVPRLSDGTLVDRGGIAFPALPGVVVPEQVLTPHQIDFGADFAQTGVITIEPPIQGANYPLLLPQVDSDGNELAGLRTAAVAVPLGTYTGWNLYDARVGPPTEMIDLQGAFIPLAPTSAIRLDGDTRPAINERFANRDEYLGRVSAHGLELVEGGYLLQDDMAGYLLEADAYWRFATGDSP